MPMDGTRSAKEERHPRERGARRALLPGCLRNETFPLRFKSSDVVDHAEDLTVISPK